MASKCGVHLPIPADPPYCCLTFSPLHTSLHFQAVALCAKVNKGEEDVEAAVEECADKVWEIV